MPPRTKPPFRADHVGSLLRPAGLKEARVRILGPDTADTNLGPHGNEELARIEDGFVRRRHRHAEARRLALGHRRRVPPA